MKLQRYQFIKTFQVKENIENLYKRKKIESSKTDVILSEKNTKLNSVLFYSTDKLLRYKRNLIKKKNTDKKIKIQNLFPKKSISLKIRILNKEVDKTYAKFLFTNLRKFTNSLFSKRYTLFFDLIKITALASENKENLNLLTRVLASIFRLLPKRRHNLFISFLKHLLNIIIVKNPKNLIGMKILINGKLQGKTRAKTVKILTGNASINTIKDNPILSKAHIYTLYGAFGLQILAKYKQ